MTDGLRGSVLYFAGPASGTRPAGNGKVHVSHAMTRSDEKKGLRSRARKLRRDIDGQAAATAAMALRDNFLDAMAEMSMARPAAVAGYWPMGGELDARPLLLGLHEGGFTCALPVIQGRGRPLVFRAWRPGADLEPGDLGTLHPSSAETQVVPQVVLVPLLAFDGRGNRLGQGGGYYDRTLADLRHRGRVLAVGLAYARQEVDSLPFERRDQRLDWIVTEDKAAAFQPGSP